MQWPCQLRKHYEKKNIRKYNHSIEGRKIYTQTKGADIECFIMLVCMWGCVVDVAERDLAFVCKDKVSKVIYIIIT